MTISRRPNNSERRSPAAERLDVARRCERCQAKCCRYIALPIDKPETFSDFDNVRWYISHRGAAVFVEDDVWHLLVFIPCKFILPDNRCGVYEKRPEICREYRMTNCEFEDGRLYEQYFELPEQIEEYAEAVLGPRTSDFDA